MDGEWHGPEAGPGEHHHCVLSRHAGCLGNKFGLAGMGEPGFGKAGLGDGARDQAARAAGQDQLHRLSE